jgi:hypothetical protein
MLMKEARLFKKLLHFGARADAAQMLRWPKFFGSFFQ